MSELKRLLTAFKAGNPCSEDAIIKLFEKSWQDNAGLRAKLEAANDKVLELDNLATAKTDEITDLEEELSATKTLLLSEGVNKKLIAQDRDNLQNELNGMTKARDTFYNDMLLYKKSCDDLIKLRDEHFNKIDNLQAAYGVLRAAIKAIREDIIYHNQVRFAGGEIFNLITPETAGKIEKAFHSTPAEAGERVRGLVEALEFYANAENYVHRVSEHAIEWIDPVVFDDTGKRAKDALAKFRGGADGE